MANFNETDIAPIQGGISVKAPVHVPATQMQNGASLAGAFAGFENLAKIGIQYMATEQKKTDAQAIVKYNNELTLIADGVDQGMPTPKAQTLVRALHQKYVAAHPTLAGDITKTTQDFMVTAGLGKKIAEPSHIEKMKEQQENDAVKAGFVPSAILADPNLSPQARQAVIDKGVKEYEEFKLAGEILQRSSAETTNLRGIIGLEKDKVELRNSKISTQTALLNLDLKRHEVASIRALHLGAAAKTDNFNSFTADIVKKVKDGQMRPEDGVAMVNTKYTEIHQFATQVGYMAGGDKINSAIGPLKSIRDTVVDVISGKLEADVYENKVKGILGKAKANLLIDHPETQKIVAASEMLGDAGVLSQVIQQKEFLDIFKNNATPGGRRSDPFPKTKGEEDGTKLYLKNLLNGVENYGKGNAKLDGEVDTHMTNTLEAASIYAAGAENPKEWQALTNFLADDKFRKYRKEGGKIDEETMRKLTLVVQQNYSKTAIPAIKQKFDEANISVEPMGGYAGQDTASSPVNNNIRPKFIGGGIVFVAEATAPGVDPKDAQKKAEALNRELAPTVNKFIKMSSNLSGEDDKAVWEKYLSPQLFPYTEKHTVEKDSKADIEKELDKPVKVGGPIGTSNGKVDAKILPDDLSKDKAIQLLQDALKFDVSAKGNEKVDLKKKAEELLNTLQHPTFNPMKE